MKKITYPILAIFFLSYSSINAQISDSTSAERNSLNKKSWALQFAVGSNFNVQSLDGLMFALKYHVSSKSAFRFGVGYSGSSNNQTLSFDTLSTPLERNYSDFLVEFSYVYYPSPSKVINIFFSVGPRADYSHSLDEYANFEEAIVKYSDEMNEWSVGLQGTFGAEWFPIRVISLFAEYTVYGTYGKSKSTYHRVSDGTTMTTESENWQFHGSTARLGLSVYF